MKLLGSCVSLSLLEILFDTFSGFFCNLETLRSVVAHFLPAFVLIGLDHFLGLFGFVSACTLLTLLHVHFETVEGRGEGPGHRLMSDRTR